MSVSGGLDKAVERGETLGCEAIQIFTRSPLQWQGRKLGVAEVEKFRRAVLGSSISDVVSHASYLINLAGDPHTRRKSIAALTDEAERCYQLGIDSVVVHPGSAKDGDRGEAIDLLADSMSEVLRATEESPVKFLLETMSGQGGVLGVTIEELADVIERLEWNDSLGICVDLCHIFGAGFDVSTQGGYERLVSTLERQVGLNRVGCWHMSDNKGTRGSNIDRHEHIGHGEIGIIPFGMLVSDDRFEQTPAVLETPKEGIGDEGNLALLRKLRGYS